VLKKVAPSTSTEAPLAPHNPDTSSTKVLAHRVCTIIKSAQEAGTELDDEQIKRALERVLRSTGGPIGYEGTQAAHVVDAMPAGRPLPQDRDALLFQTEAAYLRGQSTRTLEKERVAGGGCPFVLMGRSVRYRRGDVLEWIAGRMRKSTSDTGRAA
jgi:hypothetical protein